MTISKDHEDGLAPAPTAVEAAVRPAAVRKRDRTGAKRARLYRKRKAAASRALVPLKRDASRDASVAPTVTDSVTPAVTGEGVTNHAIVPVRRGKVMRQEARASRLASVLQSHDIVTAPEVEPVRVTVLPPLRSQEPRQWVLGLTSGALGLALAGVGLVINCRYAASLGRTAEESMLLGALGLAVDAGAVILLATSAGLRQSRHPIAAVAALVAWLAFTAASMIATAGFTSQSIGDHAAGRSAVIEQATDLREQRQEAIAVARTAVANAITARDQECGKVGENCRRRIAELNQRQAELTAAVAAPAVPPAAVSAADPGAMLLADLLQLSESTIQKTRIVVLIVAPATAGMFLAFSVMLLGRRRD